MASAIALAVILGLAIPVGLWARAKLRAVPDRDAARSRFVLYCGLGGCVGAVSLALAGLHLAAMYFLISAALLIIGAVLNLVRARGAL